jgi:drug/metabolite transporter (DMT)-like permease
LSKKINEKLDSPETEEKITDRDYKILCLVILCGSMIAPLLLLNGLNQTTAINSSLLLNAESLFTVVIAFVFLGERCSKKENIGIVLLLIGVVFVTTTVHFRA